MELRNKLCLWKWTNQDRPPFPAFANTVMCAFLTYHEIQEWLEIKFKHKQAECIFKMVTYILLGLIKLLLLTKWSNWYVVSAEMILCQANASPKKRKPSKGNCLIAQGSEKYNTCSTVSIMCVLVTMHCLEKKLRC